MCLQMLFAVLLSLVAVDVRRVQSTVKDRNMCDMTSHQLCDFLHSDVYDLLEEDKGLEQCFERNRHQCFQCFDKQFVSVSKNTKKCLVLDVKNHVNQNGNAFKRCENILELFRNMSSETEISNATEILHQDDCTWRLVSHNCAAPQDELYDSELRNEVLNELMENSSGLKDSLDVLIILVHSRLSLSITKQLTCNWVKCFLDIDDTDICFNTNTDIVTDVIESLVRNELQNYTVTNEEIILLIKVLLIIVVTTLIRNWALLIIFLGYIEFRSDPTLIIFNLAIAHTLSLIFGSVILISPHTLGVYEESNFSSVMFILWSVITLFSVHLVTEISIKKYFSLLSTETSNGQFWQHLRKFRVGFVYAIWLLAQVAQVSVTATYAVNFYQQLKYENLLNCIACCLLVLVTMTTHSVATSRDKMHEVVARYGATVNWQTMKIGTARHVQFISALIIAFVASVTPVYILDIICSYNAFKRVSYESTSTVSFSVINNFLNPVLIYGFSSIFRHCINKLCLLDIKESQINTV
jgi:hypothetical protein